MVFRKIVVPRITTQMYLLSIQLEKKQIVIYAVIFQNTTLDEPRQFLIQGGILLCAGETALRYSSRVVTMIL